MMYLLTEQEHAQIVDALTNDGTHEDDCPYSNDCFNDDCDHCAPIRDMRTTLAIAMLKAMHPMEPIACVYKGNQYMRHEFMDDKIPEGSMPLYATTKDCK